MAQLVPPVRTGGVAPVDYTTLSLADVRDALHEIARDARVTFGTLSPRQLNWRPDRSRWSVGQCFQHLLTSNQYVLNAAQRALTNPPASVWQRMPLYPSLVGRALIRSQAPTSTRKYNAPTVAQPTTSDIAADVMERFVTQQHMLADWVETIDEVDAARAIMISPFIRFVAYSVLDGCRLLVAHDHRHFQQARRVMQAPGFPEV